MKNIIKRIAILSLLITLAIAQDVDFLFEKANEHYQQENFREAIKLYEDILRNGQESGKLYYNLGNAYYKIDEIGKAVLYYEKALVLMPEDENLAFNLKLANVKVQDRIQVPEDSFIIKVHQKFINLFSIYVWSVLFSVFVLMAALVFFISVWLAKYDLKFLRNFALIAIVMAMVSGYPTLQKHQKEELTSKGVVLETVVDVFAAPDSESTRLFNIHEGTVFTILDIDGSWFKIELLDGKQGWVSRDDCGEV
ncbi:MAG: tetratricopeptide repeat protein [Candidatus Marinimicrobia bacterium]|nr:tetratricopeptide repeat protein [Candidatus Neomarinimicrobiota bacterium]